MAGGAWAIVALIVLAPGCIAMRSRVHVFPRCADGLPPRILTDPACPPDSICGYSCLPGRWADPACDEDKRKRGIDADLFGPRSVG